MTDCGKGNKKNSGTLISLEGELLRFKKGALTQRKHSLPIPSLL